MAFSAKISSERLAQSVRTDDALAAFEQSVGNGQARLAIEVLVDVINALVDKVDELEEKMSAPKKSEPVSVSDDVKPKAITDEVKPKLNKAPKQDSSNIAE
jgi:osmotically-inducible protein OsmY